ncbi:MAG: vWA domain-containing protein [Planctomycetota bacterium]|jgi:hypothetical protein
MIIKTLQNGKVRYWALVFSFAAHATALAVFTGVKLSGRIAEEPANQPALNLQVIERVIAQPTPRPKPRIESIPKPPVQTIVEQTPLVAEAPQPESEVVEVPKAIEPVVAEVVPVVNEVEFFGQKSIVRRVCYVVDCSGSMYGRMYRVRDQLKQSILNLNSQQAFSVVFFMDGQKVVATGNGALQPATAAEKSRAIKLIESVRPSGLADVEYAMQYAMGLKNSNGECPEVVYFLTDGFDLESGSSTQFVKKIDHLRISLAPGATLHTIGFDSQLRDRQMLRKLAAAANGKFIEVN